MAQAEHVISAIRSLATVACASPPTSVIGVAHAELVTTLARHRPRSIPVGVRAADLEDRADHLNTVLAAMSSYLTAILDDTAQNVPGGLELRQIDALRSDLNAELRGTLQQAVESLEWSVA
jgi:hypothetical protein